MDRNDTASDGGDTDDPTVARRRLLAAAGGVGTVLIAGCSSGTGGEGGSSDDSGGSDSGDDTTSDGSGGSGESETQSGTFRLLISDQPAAIDEFDSLEVTLDRARVFRGSTDGEEDGEAEAEAEADADGETATTEAQTETETSAETDTETQTETDTETSVEAEADAEAESEPDAEDGENSFSVIELDEPTVDLTRLTGAKATGVFEGELEAGRYSKVELYVSSVDGVVDGESVEVQVPSGKLQIVKSFEVVPGETLSFVFDISVVKRGGTGSYNLLPVISESGVAGTDVEVEMVDEGEASGGESESDDAAASGNETADSETETPEPESGTGQAGSSGNRTDGGTESAGDDE